MKTKITFELLMVSGTISLFKQVQIPALNLLVWVFLAMVIDLITGIIKAIVQGQTRSSSGYRKTVMKFWQYGISIIVGIILRNAIQNDITAYVMDGLVILLIYIEATSIFENLYAIDSTSMLAQYFIKPMLNLLTFAIKKSPVNQASDETSNK